MPTTTPAVSNDIPVSQMANRGNGHRPVPSGIPRHLSAFVGRQREVARLRELLERDDTQLVTLIGPGGVGKTRLACAAAEAAADTFPDGIAFVPLAALSDPALLALTVAQGIGVPIADDAPVWIRLLEHLQGQRLLLILDNAEHLVEAVARLVADLLRSVPTVTLMVTSREFLHIAGEWLFPVPPLSVTIEGDESGNEVGSPDAVRLFVERARERKHDFAMTADNAAVIAQICERLDGLPLAIELAAARIAHLSPTVLLSRLDQRLPLLAGVRRDDPHPRLQDMRSAVAWSYDLLSPAEQALFRRLSVFKGSFSLEAAEAIAAPGADNEAPATDQESALATLDGIDSLVSKSLVTVEAPADGQDTRYLLLETLREYGQEQLIATGEDHAVRQRHAVILHDWALECWTSANDLAAFQVSLDRLDRDHDDVRAALDWLQQHDLPGAISMAGALHWYWNIRGRRAEGLQRLESLLVLEPEGEPTPERARALMATGALVQLQRSSDEAAAYLQRAREVWTQAGVPWGAGYALLQLGMVSKDQGHYVEAGSRFREALAMLEEAGDARTARTARGNLAAVAYGAGNLDEAEAWVAQVVLTQGEAQFRDDGWMLHLRGLIAIARGEPVVAAQAFLAAAEAFMPLSYRLGLLESAAGMGTAAVDAGCLPEAAALFGAVTNLQDELRYSFQMPSRPTYERAIAQARAALPAPQFQQYHEQGRALSLSALTEVMKDVCVRITTGPPPADEPEESARERFGLSERELEVLRLAAEGLSDTDIAERLYISRRTVSSHLRSVYAKLDVKSRTAAGAFAYAHGILPDPADDQNSGR